MPPALKKGKELFKKYSEGLRFDRVKSFTHGGIRRSFVNLVDGLWIVDNSGFGFWITGDLVKVQKGVILRS